MSTREWVGIGAIIAASAYAYFVKDLDTVWVFTVAFTVFWFYPWGKTD